MYLGMEMFREHGYKSTSIQMIAEKAGVLKGSFYNFFPSKEVFATAVIGMYTEGWIRIIERDLLQPELSPFEKLAHYVNRIAERYGSHGFKFGCLVGNLTQEMGANSEIIREHLEKAYESAASHIRQYFEELKAEGSLVDHAEPSELAELLINSVEGAVLRSKVVRDDSPFRHVKNSFRSFFKQ